MALKRSGLALEKEKYIQKKTDDKKDKEKCLPLSNLFKMGCLQIESTGGEVTEAGDMRKYSCFWFNSKTSCVQNKI